MVEIWVQRQRAATFEFVKNVPVIVFVLDWAFDLSVPYTLESEGCTCIPRGFRREEIVLDYQIPKQKINSAGFRTTVGFPIYIFVDFFQMQVFYC